MLCPRFSCLRVLMGVGEEGRGEGREGLARRRAYEEGVEACRECFVLRKHASQRVVVHGRPPRGRDGGGGGGGRTL